MKYIKPKSLTWWAGFVPLGGGAVVATSVAVPELVPVAAVINEFSGHMPASALVIWGAGLIGLRAAPGMNP